MINPAQQQIVNHTEDPVLVIADPGSGKTKTLVDRFLNLVKKGVAHEAKMVGTFTEKAAKELMIDNAVVQAKKEYAQQIAAASKVKYIIVSGKKEKLLI